MGRVSGFDFQTSINRVEAPAGTPTLSKYSTANNLLLVWGTNVTSSNTPLLPALLVPGTTTPAYTVTWATGFEPVWDATMQVWHAQFRCSPSSGPVTTNNCIITLTANPDDKRFDVFVNPRPPRLMFVNAYSQEDVPPVYYGKDEENTFELVGWEITENDRPEAIEIDGFRVEFTKDGKPKWENERWVGRFKVTRQQGAEPVPPFSDLTVIVPSQKEVFLPFRVRLFEKRLIAPSKSR